MQKTCYNNGKVKIGNEVYLNKLVNPPYVETDNDMLELQSYLIGDPRILNRQPQTTTLWLRKVIFQSQEEI